ncbi:AraC family transcriptional regulator [Pontibacter sp. SGAir0037]|uniref:helix-turn-helix domain-containing protein n=1 Tax=Pontibacter sp. SGAir0037 TaxID=2571030 RepID=UPI0010CCEFF8|nr:AraC family transcriptional regulator [Pontibacter sp. SGAir0037]QCR22301.1 hypothetical protein C1N53_08105 [Pontibacter sp. SGAir0037]
MKAYKGIKIINNLHDFYREAGIPEPYSEHFDCHSYEDTAQMVRRTMPAYRGMFNQICLITKGKIHVKANNKCLDVEPISLMLSGAGHVHSWDLAQDLQGYVLHFSIGFFSINSQKSDLFETFSFLREGKVSVLTLKECQAKLISFLFRRMQEEQAEQSRGRDELIRSYLLTLLLEARKAVSHTHTMSTEASLANSQTINKFQQLINQHLRHLTDEKPSHLKSVKDYAHELCIHPNYLNEMVQKVLGKSASQLLQERTAQEALTLLRQTDLTVSQVAYRLGFESVSYFSRFFKRVTGYTPSEYRVLLKL